MYSLNPSPPAIAIGPHCSDPYECDFSNHCWAPVSTKNSVFEFNATTAWKLFDAGYHHLDQIPADYKLPPRATLQLTQARSGQVYIDAESIWQFLQPITYPLYFFDFETIMPGIPEFDNCTPYQQIPFLFSLHVKQHATAELEHIEFLGDGVTDPRPDLLEAMLAHLGTTGSIICYNMNFEKGRITDLAKTYPAAATHLLALNPRVVDLMAPFQKQWYYHPEFHGRYSIKAVLPVLVPELRYDQLEIPNGSLASLVYANLKHQDAITSTLQRQALREYCKLDTLAMVKLYEVLKAV